MDYALKGLEAMKVRPTIDPIFRLTNSWQNSNAIFARDTDVHLLGHPYLRTNVDHFTKLSDKLTEGVFS